MSLESFLDPLRRHKQAFEYGGIAYYHMVLASIPLTRYGAEVFLPNRIWIHRDDKDQPEDHQLTCVDTSAMLSN